MTCTHYYIYLFWAVLGVCFCLWRRKWQPTLVFLPGKPCRQRSLMGYSPCNPKELDTTEWLTVSFSSCGEWGLLSHCSAWASHCGGDSCCVCSTGFGSCGTWAHRLWLVGPRARAPCCVAPGFSCSTACGIFPGQGLNLCPLHGQVNSYPLSHQGSPLIVVSF